MPGHRRLTGERGLSLPRHTRRTRDCRIQPGVHPIITARDGHPRDRAHVDAVQAQRRDRLDVLEAQLEARRTLVGIDESRAEHAKRWQAYYEKLVREGKVIEDRMLAARDDVLMMDAHVAAEKAELKVAEIRPIRGSTLRKRPRPAAPIRPGKSWTCLRLCLRQNGRCSEQPNRAEQARRTETHYEKLFRGKLATEDLVLAAKDDVLMMDSVLAWGRADLKVAEARQMRGELPRKAGRRPTA